MVPVSNEMLSVNTDGVVPYTIFDVEFISVLYLMMILFGVATFRYAPRVITGTEGGVTPIPVSEISKLKSELLTTN